MADSAASYIHMVQHLIEKCLIFNMTQEDCVESLSKHADIHPVITSTVWRELEKENFEAYWRRREERLNQDNTPKKAVINTRMHSQILLQIPIIASVEIIGKSPECKVMPTPHDQLLLTLPK